MWKMSEFHTVVWKRTCWRILPLHDQTLVTHHWRSSWWYALHLSGKDAANLGLGGPNGSTVGLLDWSRLMLYGRNKLLQGIQTLGSLDVTGVSSSRMRMCLICCMRVCSVSRSTWMEQQLNMVSAQNQLGDPFPPNSQSTHQACKSASSTFSLILESEYSAFRQEHRAHCCCLFKQLPWSEHWPT